MIRLLVLLGNPGKRYEKTRHNVAWQMERYLPFAGDIIWQKKHKGELAVVAANGRRLYLLKPLTYMNKSGESVQSVCAYYGISTDEILVVHDEVELPLGIADIKEGGGFAGHKGLKSVSSCLSAGDFYRFRIGIGRPARGDVASHVLGPFTESERDILPVIMENAALTVAQCITEHVMPTAKSATDRKTKRFHLLKSE